ncbi:MAPEG family protein [bacterium]|nr:MAPEG family protein [bacterium]
MTLEITSFYAGLIGLWIITLAARIIVFRRRERVSLGDADDPVLRRRIRAMGNLTEYAPIALILLAVLELQGLPRWSLHVIGLMFVAGRLIHGWAFSFADAPLGARTVGMVLTLTSVALASVMAVVSSLF